MILIFILGLVVLRILYSVGEICYERDWPRSTWKGLLIALGVLCIAVSAFGQATRVDIPLLTSGPSIPITGGPLPQALWVANSLVYVCTHPSSTLAACQADPITTYTDSTEGTTCPSTEQMVQLPGNTCTASSGVTANVGFWYGGGVFDYWIVSSYGTYGPFSGNSSNFPSSCGNPIGIPCGGTGAITAPAALANLGGQAITPSLSGLTSVITTGVGISQPGLTTLTDGTFLSVINLPGTGSQTSTSYDGYTWQTPIIQGATNGLPTPVSAGYGYESLTTELNGSVFFSASVSENVSTYSVPSYSIGTVTNQITTYAAGTGTQGMDTDAAGNVWVANETANSATRYTASTWAIQTYTTNLSSPVAISHNATLTYILNGNGTIEVVNSAALTHSATITLSSISGVSCGNPQSIAIDNSGDANAGDIVVTCGTTANTYNVYWLNPAGTAYVTRVALGAGVGSVAVVPTTASTIASGWVGYTYVLQFVGSTTPSSLHVFGINQLEISGSPFGAPKVASGLSTDVNGNPLVSGAATELLNPSNGANLLYIQGGGSYGNAIDASGQIWVSHLAAGTVSKYSSSGVFIGTFHVGAGAQSMTVTASNVWTAVGSNVVSVPSNAYPDTLLWGTLTSFSPSNAPTNFGYNTGPMVQVTSSIWMQPVYYATVSGGTVTQDGVLRSINAGSTWTYIQVGGANYDEAAAVVLPNGDVVLILRHTTVDPNGAYAQSVSHDMGVTWSTPVDVLNVGNVVGRPSLAVWPGTSNLLLVGRGANGSTSNGTFAMTSTDEGLTWSTPSNIAITGNQDSYDALTANNGNVYVAENFGNSGETGVLSFSALTPTGFSLPSGINFGQSWTLNNIMINGMTETGMATFNYNSLTTTPPTIYNLNAGDSATCGNLILSGGTTPNQLCVYKSTFNTGGFYLNLTQSYNTQAKKLQVDSTGNVSKISSIALDGAGAGSVVMADASTSVVATSVNTPSTIVKRDGSGNFAAGVITAALNGAHNGTVGATTPAAATFTQATIQQPLVLSDTGLAATTTIAPTAAVTLLTCSTTCVIVNITPPTGCTTSGQACKLTLIPINTGITSTTAGNIELAHTFTQWLPVTAIYIPSISSWVLE